MFNSNRRDSETPTGIDIYRHKNNGCVMKFKWGALVRGAEYYCCICNTEEDYALVVQALRSNMHFKITIRCLCFRAGVVA